VIALLNIHTRGKVIIYTKMAQTIKSYPEFLTSVEMLTNMQSTQKQYTTQYKTQ